MQGVCEDDVELEGTEMGPDVEPGRVGVGSGAGVCTRVVGVCHEHEGSVKPLLDDGAVERTIHGEAAGNTAVVQHGSCGSCAAE